MIRRWYKISLLLIFVFALSFSTRAKANGVFASGGTAYAPLLASDGHSYDTASPFVLRGGYWYYIHHIPLDTYLEYQQYQVQDGSDLLSISRIHRELSAWVRYRYANKWRAKPYVALGAGAASDILKTRFNGDSTVNTQSPEFMAGGAAGVSLRIAWGIEAQLEGRITSAASYQPNPLLQMGLHLGYRF